VIYRFGVKGLELKVVGFRVQGSGFNLKVIVGTL
jgi:hypothetical protein